jgi:hypothetical protein
MALDVTNPARGQAAGLGDCSLLASVNSSKNSATSSCRQANFALARAFFPLEKGAAHDA